MVMRRLSAPRNWFLTAAVMIVASGSALAQIRPAASTCTYTLSYNSLSIPAAGGNKSVDVNTGAACGWSASADVSWITIIAGSNGTGPATINYGVISNPTTSSRTGHLTVQGQTLAITEVAIGGPLAQVQQVWMARNQVLNQTNTTACTTAPAVVTTFLPTDPAAYVFLYAINVNAGDVISTQYYAPDGTLYSNAGGAYTVPFDTQSVCLEDQGMTIVGAPPANMSGIWTANVQVNGVLMITTAFAIAGTSNCSYTLSPASMSVPPIAANGYTIAVNTTSFCAWNVVNNSSWIYVTADSSGTGPGNVVFGVSANPGGSRTAYLTIGNQVAAITQVATGGPTDQVTQIWMTRAPFPNSITPCSDASIPATAFAPTDAAAYLYLSISQARPGDVISDQYVAPSGTVYASAGGSVTVPPVVSLGCWEDPGLMIRGTQAANMTGNWTANVYVNQVLVVTTAFTMLPGSNCSYSINPAAANVAAAGGTGSIAVTADPGCPWTAATSATWIHITSGATGIGSAPVGYTADVNSGDTRTATIVIGGQTFTLSQASGLPTLPTISQGGVADPWTYSKGISPGAWVSIFGSDLANATQTWSPTAGQPLATTLAGVSVTVDGIAAAPSYVSPTLVNILVPAAIRLGPIQIVVTNNGLASLPFMIQSTQFLPAIYSNAAPGSSPPRYYVTAVDPFTNQLVGNLSADPRVVGAPKAGDTIDLYALGLGPATPQFSTDVDFTGAFPVTANVNVVLGGVSVTPAFAALVAPGLYQMRITIPAALAPGDQTILLDLGGGVQSAQNVFLSIQR
jgi:uncharacterized protein (TIGR03437 family)